MLRKMSAVQNSSYRDRTLPMAMLADIFPASAKLITAAPSTFGADKSVWPALLKKILLTGFPCLKSPPELPEADPFLLAHLCRRPSFDAAILSFLLSHYPAQYLGAC